MNTDIYSEDTRFFELPSGEKVVVDSDNRIEAQIVIGLDAAVDHDLEGFLDLISDMVTDGPLLMDFSYRVTGITPEGNLILTVNGDVSEILKWNSEEEANEKEN